jgi:DNA-binding CsgD family transcriptional regulator
MNAWRLERTGSTDASAVVAGVIEAMGGDGFGNTAMSGLRRFLGIASWSVYRVWKDRPPVMYLSGSDGVRDSTVECFATYRDRGLYRRDSSFEAAWRRADNGAPVMLQMTADEAPSAEHRDAIYLRHGMLERLSVARPDPDGSLLAVNVYRHTRDACAGDVLAERFGNLAPALIAAVARHLELTASTPEHDVRKMLLKRCPGLTRRELQVLELLLEGCTYEGIAAHLKLSLSTVQTYRARAYGRLGIHFRNQLFRMVIGGRAIESRGDAPVASGGFDDECLR